MQKGVRAREAGGSAVTRFAGSDFCCYYGFLGLAPQAYAAACFARSDQRLTLILKPLST